MDGRLEKWLLQLKENDIAKAVKQCKSDDTAYTEEECLKLISALMPELKDYKNLCDLAVFWEDNGYQQNAKHLFKYIRKNFRDERHKHDAERMYDRLRSKYNKKYLLDILRQLENTLSKKDKLVLGKLLIDDELSLSEEEKAKGRTIIIELAVDGYPDAEEILRQNSKVDVFKQALFRVYLERNNLSAIDKLEFGKLWLDKSLDAKTIVDSYKAGNDSNTNENNNSKKDVVSKKVYEQRFPGYTDMSYEGIILIIEAFVEFTKDNQEASASCEIAKDILKNNSNTTCIVVRTIYNEERERTLSPVERYCIGLIYAGEPFKKLNKYNSYDKGFTDIEIKRGWVFIQEACMQEFKKAKPLSKYKNDIEKQGGDISFHNVPWDSKQDDKQG